MKIIDKDLLDDLTQAAQTVSRKRKNLNFHSGDADLLQRMLNAFEPGTYLRPHKHENPDKREVFLLLRGRLLMLFFDEEGKINNQVMLDRSSGKYGVEIPPGIWHSAVSLEEGTVVYEIKDGPYDAETDKQFAPWAPEENSPGARAYLGNILAELNLH